MFYFRIHVEPMQQRTKKCVTYELLSDMHDIAHFVRVDDSQQRVLLN